MNRIKHSINFAFLFLALLTLFRPLIGVENASECGTLIVTYHTNVKGERLDRVRFWVVNDKQERRLYPQGNAFVEDDAKKTRTVLVEQLPKGKYILQFIVPNRDGIFEDIPARSITMAGGGVVRVDQSIEQRPDQTWQSESNIIAARNSDIYYERPESEIYLPKTGKRFYSYPSSRETYYTEGLIIIKSNLPTARWRLYHRGELLLTGEGETSEARVPAGEDYLIESETYPDYTLRIYPTKPFDVKPGGTSDVKILYTRKYGYIQVDTAMPTGEKIAILIDGDSLRGSEPLKTIAVASNNKLFWRSKPLPAGRYLVTLTPPPYYQSLSPIEVEVKKGQNVIIRPDLAGSRTIQVSANTDQAVYLLRTQDGSQAWKGQGGEFTFRDLVPGTYILSFASQDPEKVIAPNPEKIVISRYRDEHPSLIADFHIAGQLHLEGNLENYRVKIDTMDNFRQETYRQRITDFEKYIFLPEGTYLVSFLPAKDGKMIGLPKPVKVTIKPHQLSEAYGHYTNVPETFQQEEFIEPEDQGEAIVPLAPVETLITVSAGNAIVGDPFHDNLSNEMPPKTVYLDAYKIGKYQVTNGQYAAWLTRALGEGKIEYHENGGNSGLVTDKEGNALFYTNASETQSQIFATEESTGRTLFRPAPGKVDFPVVLVTWHGADLYCKDSNCRLPTEAEWENAAGMARVKQTGVPLVKYRYGFSRNDISRPWANYKTSDAPIRHERVLTTKVGFYNGKNFLPLEAKDREQVQTQNARSPVEAYDMSGNVWEWVSDWYQADYAQTMPDRNPRGPGSGTKKIAKGGCYDSLASGVRVAERLPLAPDWADAFTGFRAAAPSNP